MTVGSPGDRRRGAASHAHVCDCPDADQAGTAPATAPQVPGDRLPDVRPLCVLGRSTYPTMRKPWYRGTDAK